MSDISNLKTSKTLVVNTAKDLVRKCLEAEAKNDRVELKELLSELTKLNSAIEYIDVKMKLLLIQPNDPPKQRAASSKPLELNCFL